MKIVKFFSFFITVGSILAASFLSGCSQLVVLHPKGPVGREESALIYIAFALMMIVVIPVYIMATWFAIRYRASNKKAAYQPKWKGSAKIEWVIWMIPILIVVALSYFAWTRTYQLDPYKPIVSEEKPLRIQVVSLDWNWLFIYPDHHIATVNEVVFPAKVPLDFRLTSATVMTSFFIPQLGSQMYAMTGMKTRLHLMADETGTYVGRNLEFSGPGYVTMHFNAIVKTPDQFEAWLQNARQSPDTLSMDAYEALSEPQIHYPKTVYSSVVPGLFDHIAGQFRGWMGAKDPPKTGM